QSRALVPIGFGCRRFGQASRLHLHRDRLTPCAAHHRRDSLTGEWPRLLGREAPPCPRLSQNRRAHPPGRSTTITTRWAECRLYACHLQPVNGYCSLNMARNPIEETTMCKKPTPPNDAARWSQPSVPALPCATSPTASASPWPPCSAGWHEPATSAS